MSSAVPARPPGRADPPAQLLLALGQASDPGPKAINQDHHGARVPDGLLLEAKGAAIALADGISSSAVSHLASQIAVAAFIEDYYCTPDAWSVRQSAQRVLAATNAWLHGQTRQGAYGRDAERGYVCTFSALIIKSATAHLFHVGDARIYRIRGGELEQLTRDHRMQVSAEISYLGRALGANPHVEIDYQTLALAQGDIFVLATDGLYEFIEPETLCRFASATEEDPDRVAQRLIEHALAHGSDDNLTVQLVRVDGLPEPSALEYGRQQLDLPPAPLLEPRRFFDGFAVERELHASSRSHVYLATDTVSGARVALKIPSLDLRQDRQYLERFMLEEWVARRIHNPHVLRPVLPTRPRQYLYTVSEFLEGQTLYQWMLDHPRPPLHQVRSIIQQIASGLRGFHRLEMVHQDLRPQNIMIDPAGTVTLIDFGAVSVAGLEEARPQGLDSPLLGTCQYSAPEYFLGYAGTPQSDLYSLGVIAYQMLTGHLPYGSRVAQARNAAAQRRLSYREVTQYRSDLPAWLDEVLQQAVQVNPDRRYGDLAEFVDAFSRGGHRGGDRGVRPLLERNPLMFWQTVSALLTLLLLLTVAFGSR